eukprot:6207670-Pleurochrysis_carterae.AAC.3
MHRLIRASVPHSDSLKLKCVWPNCFDAARLPGGLRAPRCGLHLARHLGRARRPPDAAAAAGARTPRAMIWNQL